jgi:ABC transporter substrate binding protein
LISCSHWRPEGSLHGSREYVEAAGLMSYGPNLPELFRRAADYVDKILRGAKPGDIPVEQPRKFDLIINPTTAKALGLTIRDFSLSVQLQMRLRAAARRQMTVKLAASEVLNYLAPRVRNRLSPSVQQGLEDWAELRALVSLGLGAISIQGQRR